MVQLSMAIIAIIVVEEPVVSTEVAAVVVVVVSTEVVAMVFAVEELVFVVAEHLAMLPVLAICGTLELEEESGFLGMVP